MMIRRGTRHNIMTFPPPKSKEEREKDKKELEKIKRYIENRDK
jgi:hypothetical protein